jgi:hypothetical protein
MPSLSNWTKISPAMNCQQPSVRWQSPGSPVFGLRMQGFIDCLTSSRPFPISPGHFHGWGFYLAAPAELWETTGAAVCQSLAFAGTNAFRSGHARPRISLRFRPS